MKKIDRYFIGQIARLQAIFTEDDMKKWSILTRDFNDIYRSEYVSLTQPLVPGILSEGLMTEVISKELPGEPCVIMQKELLFLQPVQIGNTITAEVEIININEERNWITEKVRCLNEHGIEVIKGQIIIKLL